MGGGGQPLMMRHWDLSESVLSAATFGNYITFATPTAVFVAQLDPSPSPSSPSSPSPSPSPLPPPLHRAALWDLGGMVMLRVDAGCLFLYRADGAVFFSPLARVVACLSRPPPSPSPSPSSSPSPSHPLLGSGNLLACLSRQDRLSQRMLAMSRTCNTELLFLHKQIRLAFLHASVHRLQGQEKEGQGQGQGEREGEREKERGRGRGRGRGGWGGWGCAGRRGACHGPLLRRMRRVVVVVVGRPRLPLGCVRAADMRCDLSGHTPPVRVCANGGEILCVRDDGWSKSVGRV